jgi:hypothetical protein
MNFLSRFTNAQPEELEMEELPQRRRTFSATQFREEELARAASARAAQETAEAVRAQSMADSESDNAGFDDVYGESASEASSCEPPMDWEQVIGWLSTRSSEARSFVAQNWNWEHDLRILQFLVAQPDMDMGVAAGILWLTGATDDFFPWSDDEEPEEPQYQRACDMVLALGKRFAADDFMNRDFGFDDSWDCSGLKERLESLYLEERIDWSPGNIPTASPGVPMTIRNVPELERAEIEDFLSRHGI